MLNLEYFFIFIFKVIISTLILIPGLAVGRWLFKCLGLKKIAQSDAWRYTVERTGGMIFSILIFLFILLFIWIFGEIERIAA